MKVPGSGEEIYHVEKTTVVMRNEYYNNINKTYISNFDLAKLDADDVVGEGASDLLTGDLGDNLDNLDKDVLDNMKASEQEMVNNLLDNIKNIDSSIKATQPEDVPWYKKLFSNLDDIFAGKKDEYALFKESRSALEKADTTAKAEKAIENLKGNINKQEETFFKDSYKDYDKIKDEAEKTAFRRAYDMAVQQKTIDDAYKELNDPTQKKPTSNIELQQKIVDDSYKEEQQAKTQQEKNEIQERRAEAQKIIDYYEKLDISWMDDENRKSEIGIYKANKNLLDQANTKFELLSSKEKCEGNIAKIDEALAKK